MSLARMTHCDICGIPMIGGMAIKKLCLPCWRWVSGILNRSLHDCR